MKKSQLISGIEESEIGNPQSEITYWLISLILSSL